MSTLLSVALLGPPAGECWTSQHSLYVGQTSYYGSLCAEMPPPKHRSKYFKKRAAWECERCAEAEEGSQAVLGQVSILTKITLNVTQILLFGSLLYVYVMVSGKRADVCYTF